MSATIHFDDRSLDIIQELLINELTTCKFDLGMNINDEYVQELLRLAEIAGANPDWDSLIEDPL